MCSYYEIMGFQLDNKVDSYSFYISRILIGFPLGDLCAVLHKIQY